MLSFKLMFLLQETFDYIINCLFQMLLNEPEFLVTLVFHDFPKECYVMVFFMHGFDPIE